MSGIGNYTPLKLHNICSTLTSLGTAKHECLNLRQDKEYAALTGSKVFIPICTPKSNAILSLFQRIIAFFTRQKNKTHLAAEYTLRILEQNEKELCDPKFVRANQKGLSHLYNFLSSTDFSQGAKLQNLINRTQSHIVSAQNTADNNIAQATLKATSLESSNSQSDSKWRIFFKEQEKLQQDNLAEKKLLYGAGVKTIKHQSLVLEKSSVKIRKLFTCNLFEHLDEFEETKDVTITFVSKKDKSCTSNCKVHSLLLKECLGTTDLAKKTIESLANASVLSPKKITLETLDHQNICKNNLVRALYYENDYFDANYNVYELFLSLGMTDAIKEFIKSVSDNIQSATEFEKLYDIWSKHSDYNDEIREVISTHLIPRIRKLLTSASYEQLVELFPDLFQYISQNIEERYDGEKPELYDFLYEILKNVNICEFCKLKFDITNKDSPFNKFLNTLEVLGEEKDINQGIRHFTSRVYRQHPQLKHKIPMGEKEIHSLYKEGYRPAILELGLLHLQSGRQKGKKDEIEKAQKTLFEFMQKILPEKIKVLEALQSNTHFVGVFLQDFFNGFIYIYLDGYEDYEKAKEHFEDALKVQDPTCRQYLVKIIQELNKIHNFDFV